MDVIILLVFVSLILVSLGLVLFLSRLKDGDFEHGERLSLLPLAEDEAAPEEEAGAESAKQAGGPAS